MPKLIGEAPHRAIAPESGNQNRLKERQVAEQCKEGMLDPFRGVGTR
jgi:hypothetical protein